MSASEGQRVAGMTLQTLNGLRNDFQSFWVNVKNDAEKLKLKEPQKPRQKNPPSRLSTSPGWHPTTTEDHYRIIYLQGVDSIINCISDRFNQPGYQQYKKLDDLLLCAVNGKDVDHILSEICLR